MGRPAGVRDGIHASLNAFGIVSKRITLYSASSSTDTSRRAERVVGRDRQHPRLVAEDRAHHEPRFFERKPGGDEIELSAAQGAQRILDRHLRGLDGIPGTGALERLDDPRDPRDGRVAEEPEPQRPVRRSRRRMDLVQGVDDLPVQPVGGAAEMELLAEHEEDADLAQLHRGPDHVGIVSDALSGSYLVAAGCIAAAVIAALALLRRTPPAATADRHETLGAERTRAGAVA